MMIFARGSGATKSTLSRAGLRQAEAGDHFGHPSDNLRVSRWMGSILNSDFAPTQDLRTEGTPCTCCTWVLGGATPPHVALALRATCCMRRVLIKNTSLCSAPLLLRSLLSFFCLSGRGESVIGLASGGAIDLPRPHAGSLPGAQLTGDMFWFPPSWQAGDPPRPRADPGPPSGSTQNRRTT